MKHILNSELLQLEKLNDGDYSYHYQLVSDALVMKMVTGKPLNPKEAQDKFRQMLQSNTRNPELGYFKITDQESKAFIGITKLEIEEKDSSEAELGYLILPHFWGKGIGSKVVESLLELAMNQNQIQMVFAIIDPKNIPSRKILVKNGFQSKEFKDFDGLPGEVLELTLRSA